MIAKTIGLLLAFLAILANAGPYMGPSLCGECVPSQVWNDIVIVIDGSMDQEVIDNYIQKTFGQLNIGQNPKSQSRVGVIVYGDRARVFGKLSTFHSSQQFLNAKITNVTAKSYSMVAGLNAAKAIFMDSRETRVGAPKVLVIVGTDIPSNEGAAAMKIASQFQKEMGTVVAISPHTTHSPSINLLASGMGYQISEDLNPPKDILKSMCYANCFCSPSYTSINTDQHTPTIPHDGCLRAGSGMKTQAEAKSDCAFHKELLVSTRDDPTSDMVTRVRPFNTTIYIGLEKVVLTTSGNATWLFSDGTPFYTKDSYKTITGTGKCGSIIYPGNGAWSYIANDCEVEQFYTCMKKPCSATNNCL